MKLRNKKTGEIVEYVSFQKGGSSIVMYVFDTAKHYYYSSLTELNKEWEDYEEPKEHWCITMYGGITRIKDNEEPIDDLIEIGNYFNSKEDAYDALDKLKAWKRLEDLGTEILGWEIRDMPTGGNWQTVNVKLNVKARKEPMELLDLLFGGEE